MPYDITLIQKEVMKKVFLATIAAFILFLSPSFAQTPPSTTSTEYNLSYCSNKFGIIHSSLDVDKDGKETLSFISVATGPGEVTKYDAPITFNVIETKTLKSGAIARKASTNDPDLKDLNLTFFVYQNRLVGVFTQNGKLTSVLYGLKGSVDNIFDSIETSLVFCGNLYQLQKEEEIPQALIEWLLQDLPKSDEVPSSKT